MGSPLYRQEQEFNRQGFMISRQTMSNQMIRCAEDWMLPVYEELHKKLLELTLLHADETELQVLHEEGRNAKAKSYMWLYRTSGDARYPIVLYEYQPGRGQEYPKNFLEGFQGYLQTDGYSGYNAVVLGTRPSEVRRSAPGRSEGEEVSHGRAGCGLLQSALQAGGKVQKPFAGRAERTAAEAGKACFRRDVGMGKYTQCPAKVQAGRSSGLSEEPVAEADCVS